jgi:endonuclease I
MKKIFILLIAFVFITCSKSGNDDPIINPTPTDDGKPTAVDDSFNAIEDTPFIISGILNNDSTIDSSVLKSFDQTSSENGTIVDNRDNTFTYNPPSGFVGTDTFTYTICDNDTPANCSTATVSINVEDQGSPLATNDAINGAVDVQLTIATLLENDELIDDAILTSIDDSNSIGTVILNNDNTITYTPSSGFIGEDSFSYTICDDDKPQASCSTAAVTIQVLDKITFNIPSDIQEYYENVFFTEDSDLNFNQLKEHTISNHTTILSYGQRHEFLYNADADLDNSDNVVLMYSGESRYWEEYTSGTNPYSPQTFNTEHIFPQSKLNSEGAVTDLHHLRSCDATVNSDRLNYPFTDGSGNYKLIGETWFPGDEWKGDVARMVLYLNLRYNENINSVGTIDLFLKWNIEDPVSPFELQRNNVIYAAQGNRNPLIDNPYLATLIWGGDDAENRW